MPAIRYGGSGELPGEARPPSPMRDSSIINAILVTLALSACAQETGVIGDGDFVFTAQMGVSPDVTEVRHQNTQVDISVDSNGFRWAIAHFAFADYEAAKASPPLSFEFVSGATVVNAGETAPGFCASSACGGQSCPPSNELTEELVFLPQADFARSEFVCLECISAEAIVHFCREP